MRCVNRLRKCSDIHIKYILKNTNFYNWRRVQESKLYCEFEKCVTTIHCKHTGSFTCMYFLQILAIIIIIIRFSITRLCCCSEGRKKLQPPKIFRVNGRILYPNVFIHIIFDMWMRVNAPYVFLLSLMCAWPHQCVRIADWQLSTARSHALLTTHEFAVMRSWWLYFSVRRSSAPAAAAAGLGAPTK